MPLQSKQTRYIFFIYWFLLLYIMAALVWWFIALNRQNEQMVQLKLQELIPGNPAYDRQYAEIQEMQKRKTAQYTGEGTIFFLLIVAGAVFVYRAVNRELKLSRQQQNFMMALTHELKTPIAIARINLETLQKRKLDESQQQQIIQNTLQETNRLNNLCNNMLVSSQFESGGYKMTLEDMDLSGLLSQTMHDYIQRFPKRTFRLMIGEGIFVSGDNMLLQIAVNNLVENAIKYSPKESPITVELSRHGDLVRISVKDEGPGITGPDKEKVFEKFYRVGNEATKLSRGTGLGLYLSKKIILAHKGNIFLDDNSPRGSIFNIELKTAA